jgi:hypothetical protein
MLSRLREHFGAAGLIVAIVALVAALAGGAIAATGGSGNGKATASAKAKKGPKGPKGAKGDPGPAGPQGPAGANGKDGAAGANGAAGASVTNTPVSTGVPSECANLGGAKFSVGSGTPTFACNGKAGNQGPAGPPGPTCDEEGKCLLPSGATETGLFSVGTTKAAPIIRTAISFPLRLSEEPAFHYVNESDPNEIIPPECPGSSVEPSALPGNLCLYAAVNGLGPGQTEGATPDPTSGAVLFFFLEKIEDEYVESGFALGSWAVTAP